MIFIFLILFIFSTVQCMPQDVPLQLQFESAIQEHNVDFIHRRYKEYQSLSEFEKEKFLSHINFDTLLNQVTNQINVESPYREQLKKITRSTNNAYTGLTLFYTSGLLLLHGLTIGTHENPAYPYLAQNIIIGGAIIHSCAYYYSRKQIKKMENQLFLVKECMEKLQAEKNEFKTKNDFSQVASIFESLAD